MRHSFTVMIQFPNFFPPDLNYYQVLEFLMGYCLKIYFLISKICIQITPMVSQNTLDWSFYLFFDWDFISRIVLRPSLNRSSDEWIESTIPVAQSICTHYSFMKTWVGLWPCPKYGLQKAGCKKTGLLLLKKRSWGTSTSFLFVQSPRKKVTLQSIHWCPYFDSIENAYVLDMYHVPILKWYYVIPT